MPMVSVTTGIHRGFAGGRIRRIFASCGVLPPFRLLQARQAGHEIFPGGLTALHLWNNVVEGQVLGGIFHAAVLAGIFIALVDIGAGESHFPAAALHFHQFEQPENGGQEFEGDGHAADVTIVEIDDLHLALGQ